MILCVGVPAKGPSASVILLVRNDDCEHGARLWKLIRV